MVTPPESYEPADDESVTDTVVRAVADSKDADPLDLNVRLYDVIDPDALAAFFRTSGAASGCRVSFTIADRRVVVDESGCVHVTPLADDPNASNGDAGPGILRGAATPWKMSFGSR